MKLLSQKLHGILDYATVLFLALSPSVFNMLPNAALFTYTLAFVHLVLTMFTNFEMGIFRVVPFYVHGIIEISVSVLLVVISFLFFMYHDNTSFYFYLIFAVVLFIVWCISNYALTPSFKKSEIS
jgi:hypothetical protein